MPILTTVTMFGLGAATNMLSSYRKASAKKRQRLTTTSAKSPAVQQNKAVAAEETSALADDSGEAQLAKAMPLAIASSIGAIAALANPVFTLPAVFICGWLTIPLMRDGVKKYIKHRHIAILLDAVLVPTLIMLNQLLAASLVLVSSSISRRVLAKTYDRSRKSLRGILHTLPKQVWLLVDNVEVEVDYRHIKPGDVVVVNNTDLIPVDGKVIQGEALIDQMMLTGEAVPAEKIVGDQVYAGTQVVSGRIFVKLEKSGNDTHAGEVSSLILNAADRRTAVQERGEMVVEKSLPPLLMLSGIVGLTSGLTRALGVYFVCPGYSMRVLSPLSLLQSLRDATDAGILVKDGRSLELLNGIDTVVFDKTGTLTSEQPHVEHIYTYNGYKANEILTYSAAVEHKQSHPIAKAILEEAERRHLTISEVDDAQYIIGYGLTAKVNRELIQVGSIRFIEMEGIQIPPEVRETQADCYEQGDSLVLVAINKQVAGAIKLSPSVRPETKSIIQGLRQRGIKSMYIISGDHEAPTRKLAKELGIEHYFAETLPENKAQLIQQLQDEGKSVCYVGDGINDAIALKKAKVSISLSGASTVAVDTAQVILMDGNLSKLCALFDLAQEFDMNVKSSFMMNLIPSAINLGGALFLGFGLVEAFLLPQLGLLISIANSMQPLVRRRTNEDQKVEERIFDGNTGIKVLMEAASDGPI